MPLSRDSAPLLRGIVPNARMSGTLSRISNGISAGTANSIPAQTMHVFPVYIPTSISSAAFQFRTSGSTTNWPGTQGALTFTIRCYENRDNLPGQALSVGNTLSVAANTATNTWFSAGSAYSLPRGWVWIGFIAHASAIEVAGIQTSSGGFSFESAMFSKLVGVGASQTSVMMGLASAVDATFASPASLLDRTLDMSTSVASQSTLRTRTNAPMIWISY